jgi:hypothetical protein
VLRALCTSVAYTAELVSVSISHWAATVCIQPATLLTNCAYHIARTADDETVPTVPTAPTPFPPPPSQPPESRSGNCGRYWWTERMVKTG